MPFDQNNNYSGVFLGKDRLGFTTPDPDGSEILRPFLPVPYPAPWLPGRRRDEGHPVGAQVVLSAGYAVGLDKSGALVPAGLKCGTLANGAAPVFLNYTQDDIGFAYNPRTGAFVTAADVAKPLMIAAAGDQAAATINNVAYSAGDITWAKGCDLFPGGTSRAIGYAIRNVFQYLGGVDQVTSLPTGGMQYKLNGMQPGKFKVHNYMHEPGTAIQTSMVLRFPWIGKDLSALETAATAAGLTVGTDYSFTDFSKSFVHFTGDLGNAAGKLYRGCSVVPSDLSGDSGNYRPFDSTKDSADQIIGRVLGIENMYPIRDYADRVRTQFDRAQGFVGPFADRNPQTMLMGGSATRGMDYAIALGTNGLLRALMAKGVTNIPDVAGTYVWVGVRTI